MNQKYKHNRNYISNTSVWTPYFLSATPHLSGPTCTKLTAASCSFRGHIIASGTVQTGRYLPMMSRSAFSRASLTMPATWET